MNQKGLKVVTNYYVESIISFFDFGRKRPQLWNVDTDYINVIKRLIELLKYNNIKEIKKLSTKKVLIDNKEKFELHINDINITPISKKTQQTAESTMRQYLQFFSSFSWIKFNEKEKTWFKQDEFIFEVKIGMNKLLQVDNFYDFIKELLIELIITGSISYIKYKVNLAYSFFIYYVYNNDPNLIKNLKIDFQKNRKKENCKYFSSDSLDLEEYLKHIKKKKGSLSNTYYNSFELFKNIDFNSLIKTIYYEIQKRYSSYDEIQNSNENSISSTKRQDLETKILLDSIKNARSKLRNKIIEQRIHNKWHSDILPLNNKNIELEKPVYILEACHIYEINQIKESISETQDEQKEQELLNYCSDPNNGLMLPKDYHYYFDRGIITFNFEGNAILDDDYLEDLHKCGIYDFKIKEEYFNEQMKEYFIKRYN